MDRASFTKPPPAMMDTIETERTRIRPFEAADAESAHQWFSDPAVMQFIPGGRDVTRDRSQGEGGEENGADKFHGERGDEPAVSGLL